ncbi:MAG TPA: sulfatase-like hydrolase/transferase [Puia sp.]|nr:sulfatase-like hydrolase/transferase [Puia sp.]
MNNFSFHKINRVWGFLSISGYTFIIFLILKAIFFALNFKGFSIRHTKEIYFLAIYSLRFDLIAALIVSLPVYIAVLIVKGHPLKKIIIAPLYALIIFLVMFLGITDALYFHFNFRRISVNDFPVMWQNIQLAPYLFTKYWYLVLFVIICPVITFFAVQRILTYMYNRSLTIKQYIAGLLGMIFFLGILLYDFNSRYWFTPASAFFITKADNVPFISNVLIETALSYKNEKKSPDQYLFMDDDKAKSFVPVVHEIKGIDTGKKNIVLFIIESASREDFRPGQERRKLMPFIDSLMNQSMVFDNFFANGLASPAGFQAIIGGLPCLGFDDYFLSGYSYNKTEWMPDVLKKNGYRSYFFYGIRKFEFSFLKSIENFGFDEDFGYRNYTAGPNSNDGTYGIYDHLFFPAVALRMQKIDQPFFATIYNISTHIPFNLIPASVLDTLPDFPKSNGKSLRYYNDVLSNFFHQIQTRPWFNNTLFLFVSDHFSRASDRTQNTKVGAFEIPFFIYDPSGKLKGHISRPGEQIDIPCTILDLCNIHTTFFSYGHSLFDRSCKAYCYNQLRSTAQLIDSSFVIQYDLVQRKPDGLYNYFDDPGLQKDLSAVNKSKADSLITQLHAFYQVFTQTLTHNQMDPSTFGKK